MNLHINGTHIQDTTRGLVATRGKREIYFLGTSVESIEKAKNLLANHSFNKLFTSKTAFGTYPLGNNTRAINCK